MSWSVVIPSRNSTNLAVCIAGLRKCEPSLDPAKIIVVDDGLDRLPADAVTVIDGMKPFVFSRNVNLGINYALGFRHGVTKHPENCECCGGSSVVWGSHTDTACDGVFVLNDDAILESPGGFSLVAQCCDQDLRLGIVGAVTNVTGQPLQFRQKIGLRVVPHIAFVCVYIPRRTIDKLGLLDERYSIDYGCEDRDYCIAVKRAGLKVAVHDGCFVDHGKLTSTFRGDPKAPKSFEKNLGLLLAKWNMTRADLSC